MLITVITVTFNAAESLALTAKSVLEQSYTDYQYIIVDGASSDITPKLLQSLTVYPHIRWVSEPDKGIYDAMNKGAKMADGHWIIYLNAGDVFNDSKVLASVARVLCRTDAGIVYGDTVYDYNYKRKLIRADKPLYDIKKRMIFCHQSVFVLRELYLGHPYDLQYRICADFEFFNAMYKRGVVFERISDLVISIYEATDGLSSKNKSILAHEVYRIRTGGDNFWWYIKYLIVSLRDFLLKWIK